MARRNPQPASASQPVQPAAQATQTVNENLLAEIYDASNSPVGYSYAAKEELEFLAAEGYVEVNPNQQDDDGNFAVRITQKGKDYMQTNAPGLITQPQENNTPVAETQVSANSVAAAATGAPAEKRKMPNVVVSGVVSGIQLPEPTSRGGARPEKYPFSKLGVGEAFFIQATDEIPDPTKQMASTVASARARYAEVIEGQFKKNRKNEDVPEVKIVRDFRIQRIEDGKMFGPQFAGKKGAAVVRTQ